MGGACRRVGLCSMGISKMQTTIKHFKKSVQCTSINFVIIRYNDSLVDVNI